MTHIYSTAQDIRDLLDLTVEEATDQVLESFIEKAQHVVLHYVQTEVLDEEVTLDSSGKTIQVSHAFLADTNFDEKVDATDITVYGWTKADDIESRSTLPVSEVWPEYGLIKLQSDASSYEKVTVSYSYYTTAMDWFLLRLATAYYAAMLWLSKEHFLVPEQLTIGNIKVRQRQPWEELRKEFNSIIYHLTSLPMDIVHFKKIVKGARQSATLYGPGTSLESDLRNG